MLLFIYSQHHVGLSTSVRVLLRLHHLSSSYQYEYAISIRKVTSDPIRSERVKYTQDPIRTC